MAKNHGYGDMDVFLKNPREKEWQDSWHSSRMFPDSQHPKSVDSSSSRLLACERWMTHGPWPPWPINAEALWAPDLFSGCRELLTLSVPALALWISAMGPWIWHRFELQFARKSSESLVSSWDMLRLSTDVGHLDFSMWKGKAVHICSYYHLKDDPEIPSICCASLARANKSFVASEWPNLNHTSTVLNSHWQSSCVLVTRFLAEFPTHCRHALNMTSGTHTRRTWRTWNAWKSRANSPTVQLHRNCLCARRASLQHLLAVQPHRCTPWLRVSKLEMWIWSCEGKVAFIDHTFSCDSGV